MHGVVCRSCVFAMHSGALCVDRRDGEKAFVSVNGKKCWKQTFAANEGAHVCGSRNSQWFKDRRVTVICEAEAGDGKMTVRTYSNVNQGPHDESFAIDNVVIAQISAGTVA